MGHPRMCTQWPGMEESFAARVQRGLLMRALREQGALLHTRLSLSLLDSTRV